MLPGVKRRTKQIKLEGDIKEFCRKQESSFRAGNKLSREALTQYIENSGFIPSMVESSVIENEK